MPWRQYSCVWTNSSFLVSGGSSNKGDKTFLKTITTLLVLFESNTKEICFLFLHGPVCLQITVTECWSIGTFPCSSGSSSPAVEQLMVYSLIFPHNVSLLVSIVSYLYGRMFLLIFARGGFCFLSWKHIYLLSIHNLLLVHWTVPGLWNSVLKITTSF